MRAGVSDLESVAGIGTTLARTHMIICILGPEGLSPAMLWNLPNTLTWLRIFSIRW